MARKVAEYKARRGDPNQKGPASRKASGIDDADEDDLDEENADSKNIYAAGDNVSHPAYLLCDTVPTRGLILLLDNTGNYFLLYFLKWICPLFFQPADDEIMRLYEAIDEEERTTGPNLPTAAQLTALGAELEEDEDEYIAMLNSRVSGKTMSSLGNIKRTFVAHVPVYTQQQVSRVLHYFCWFLLFILPLLFTVNYCYSTAEKIICIWVLDVRFSSVCFISQ